MSRPLRPATLFLFAVTLLVAVLLYSPLFVPILSSFFTINHGDVDWGSPTLSAYWKLVGNNDILSALRTTLVVGLSTVVLSVLSGTLLALSEMLAAAGLTHPSQVSPAHLACRLSPTAIKLFSQRNEYLRPGELLEGEISSDFYARMWALAQAESFEPRRL